MVCKVTAFKINFANFGSVAVSFSVVFNFKIPCSRI